MVQRSIKKKWSKAQTSKFQGSGTDSKDDEMGSDFRGDSSPLKNGRMTPKVPYDKNNKTMERGDNFSTRLEQFNQIQNSPADNNRWKEMAENHRAMQDGQNKLTNRVSHTD